VHPPSPCPPDLYRRHRQDRFLKVLTAFMDAYFPRVPPPGPRRGLPEASAVTAPCAFPLTVAARRDIALDTIELTLTPPHPAATLRTWQPGCHLDLTLPSGRVRPYSLCGDPADRTAYRIAVRRIPHGRGGSAEVHDTLHPGTQVTARGPYNDFPFAAEPALLFIAGGIGITPLLPMAREAARRNLDWHLVRTGRTRATLPYTGELAALDPTGQRTTLHTYDTHGHPEPTTLLAHAPSPDAAVYCCGPAPLLDALRHAIPAGATHPLHAQRFTPQPAKGGAPFTLRLADGTRLPIPADRTALDVLLDARPATAYSCRQGFCGTCRTHVLAGTPEHRDHCLTPAERADGAWLPCVSRASEATCLDVNA
jgi:ferredoxin-NADP reductase